MVATIRTVMPHDSAVVWEEIPCPLCGASQGEELLTAPTPTGQPDHRLVRCRSCGLGYLNPRPDRQSIGQFYPEEYEWYQVPTPSSGGWGGRLRRHLERLVGSHFLGDPPPLTRWHQKLLARACGWWLHPGRDSLAALPFHGEGRLLDYGCGAGWYAYRMSRRGWTVTGMDFSPHAARRLTDHFGIPGLVGTLPHPEVRPESFDVITMGCVLEHVHNPHEIIAAAAEALRPGGLLVIVVPNVASWGFRYFGPDWWPLELPIHLLHFTPATLRRLVEMHGLQVNDLSMLARASWMGRSLATARQNRGRYGWRGWLVDLGKLRLTRSLLTRWAVRTGQADCIRIIAQRPAASLQAAISA